MKRLILLATLTLLLAGQSFAACTQALPSSAKQEFLSGTHVPGTDVFKMAFFTNSATWGAATTAYAVTNEVTGTGYTAGGFTVTPTAGLSGTTGLLDFADIAPTGVTFDTAADCAVLYNSSKTDKAIAIYTFSAVQPSAGTLTVDFPASGASTSAIQFAKLLMKGGADMLGYLVGVQKAYADEEKPFILGVTRRDATAKIGELKQ